jgi:hypothetical protein
MAKQPYKILQIVSLIFVSLSVGSGLLGYAYFEIEATTLKQQYLERFGEPGGTSPSEVEAYWLQDADLAARMRDAWFFSLLSKSAMIVFAVLSVLSWLAVRIISPAASAGKLRRAE